MLNRIIIKTFYTRYYSIIVAVLYMATYNIKPLLYVLLMCTFYATRLWRVFFPGRLDSGLILAVYLPEVDSTINLTSVPASVSLNHAVQIFRRGLLMVRNKSYVLLLGLTCE